MATEPDEAFVRNYFACYESEPSSFDFAGVPASLENDLENCNCGLSCCFKFSIETRLLLRAGYQSLTPAGRTAFLATHTREPSPSQTQYLLPIVGMGLEKVCSMHFLNTLRETRDRVRQVVYDKRVTYSLEDEGVDDEDEGYIPNKKRRKAVKLERMSRGLSYTTGRSNRVMPARKVKAPCNVACNYKCYERFPLAARQAKLKQLLQMPLAKQRAFLADHVCKLTPKTRRRKVDKPTNVRLTIYYFFEEEGRKLHKVCKTMFLNTYDITERGLRNLIAEKGANENVICGNPKLSRVIKREKRMVFDIDEDGLKRPMEELEEFPIEIGRVKVEELELEMDEIKQEILPDSPLVDSGEDTKAHVLHSSAIYTGLDEASEPSNVSIKVEFDHGNEPEFPIATVNIKTEMIEPDSEQPQFMEDLPRDDDFDDEEFTNDPEADKDDDDDDDDESITDSQGEIPSPKGTQPTSEIVRRESKMRGLSYTTRTGRNVPARAVKPNCGPTCALQCFLRVPDAVRQRLLANLLRMTTKKQRAFVGEHICGTNAPLLRSLTGRRTLSYHYFLPVESRLVKVCKTMFANTFDLSGRIVRKIVLEKGAAKHVVCGNANFPSLLRERDKFYFEYGEGCDQADAVPQNVWEEACKCHLQCESKFPEQMIEQIRISFRKTSKEQHQDFLAKYVRLTIDKNNQHKNALFRTRFFLPLGATVEEVCRKMFLRTFKLTTGQVSALLKNLSNSPADLLLEDEDPFELARQHIAGLRMDDDHRCAVSGTLVKLSRCPNVARMYNKYLVRCWQGVEPIDYQQYYGEFSRTFVRTGLQLPTKCPHCGFFEGGEEED